MGLTLEEQFQLATKLLKNAIGLETVSVSGRRFCFNRFQKWLKEQEELLQLAEEELKERFR